MAMINNTVASLKKHPFAKRSDEEKRRTKELGPDRPDLLIQQQGGDRGRTYTRGFSRVCYEKRSWLTGCPANNAFYCFPCLLFQTTGTDQTWTILGVRDLKHLSEKCKRHEGSRSHLDNSLKLLFFGGLSISEQLDESYRMGIKKHNEEVTRNRHILSRIIDCVKFSGAFEFALRGHDENETSDNPRTSKTVQTDLLNCMLSVIREHIIQEAQSSDFLSIQADEAMDGNTQSQLVLVLRYIDAKNNLQERFLEFIPLQSATVESVSSTLKERLAAILPEDQRGKLICQAYDGASVMRGVTAGVPRKVHDLYTNAHYIHCYVHQLNLIMWQATFHISKVGSFFSDLSGFSSFFSKSAKRTGVLDKIVAHRLPTFSSVRWNFHSRAINTVFDHREDLIRCFENIRDSGDFDPNTVREAEAFITLLEHPDFKFLLELFHSILHPVNLLSAKLQERAVDSAHMTRSMEQFQLDIQRIRNSLYFMVEQSPGESSSAPAAMKRRRVTSPEEHERIGEEVCDTLLGHIRERFSFTSHLDSATLLQSDRFAEFAAAFPDDALNSTLKAYPMINGSKLRTELSLIYSNVEFRACRGAVDLFQMFMESFLGEVFSETITLLKIIITTPMISAEAERCPSTSKHIKTFLRNTTTQERLNALTILSMEKRLVAEMANFNQKVIDKFAEHKDRRAKFMYK